MTSESNLHEQFFGQEHLTVIEPYKGLFDLKLRELWAYRDLILLFVRRDFVAQYKQTVLGPAWHIIQPLLTTVIFTIVFGRIAQISTDGAPPFLFYMAGTVIWGYFAGVLQDTSGTFIRNAHIFGKVYFPRLAVPVATLMSKFIGFAIQFVFFIGFLLFFMASGANVAPNGALLLLPILLVMMAAFGLGLGVIVSAATTRYRDLAVVVSFGVQLYMYLSPVVYPMSSLSEHYRTLMAFNPVAPILETFRYATLGIGGASVAELTIAAGVIFVVLAIGVTLFNRVERTFMDTV
ncbi:MAG: ABC transporter permease [Gammaproteobacteria bacterium]|nr:ABC transporter permease [Gammaproteobacteria bacterium]